MTWTAAIVKHLELIRMHRSCNEAEVKYIVDTHTGDDKLLFKKLIDMNDAYWDMDWNELFKRRGIR